MAVRYSLNELAELAAMQDSLMDRGSIADSLERDGRNVENDPATPPAGSSPDKNSFNNSAPNSSEESIQQNSNNVGESNSDDQNSPATTNENNDDPSSSSAAEHSNDLDHHQKSCNNEKEGGDDHGEEDDPISDWRKTYYTFPTSEDNPPPLPVLITSHETHEGALRVWGHGNKATNITADWKRAWAIPDQFGGHRIVYDNGAANDELLSPPPDNDRFQDESLQYYLNLELHDVSEFVYYHRISPAGATGSSSSTATNSLATIGEDDTFENEQLLATIFLSSLDGKKQGSKVDINLRGNTTTFTNLLPENLEPYEKLHPSQTIQQYFTIDGYCAKHNLKLLYFFHEFNGRLSKAGKKVGGPRGIVTPAWYLWRNRNEATLSDDHLRFHNLNRRSVVETEPYVNATSKTNTLDNLDLYVISLWVTKCPAHRLDCIIYSPLRDECYRISTCASIFDSRTLRLDLDPVGPHEIDDDKCMRAYKAYRDKYNWEEIEEMPMKVGTKHPQEVRNRIMREDAAIEAASSAKSTTRGRKRKIDTVVEEQELATETNTPKRGRKKAVVLIDHPDEDGENDDNDGGAIAQNNPANSRRKASKKKTAAKKKTSSSFANNNTDEEAAATNNNSESEEEVPASNNKSNTTRGGRSYGVAVDNTASTSIASQKAVSHEESLMQMITSLKTEILELKKGRQEKDDQQSFVDKQPEVFGKKYNNKESSQARKMAAASFSDDYDDEQSLSPFHHHNSIDYRLVSSRNQQQLQSDYQKRQSLSQKVSSTNSQPPQRHSSYAVSSSPDVGDDLPFPPRHTKLLLKHHFRGDQELSSYISFVENSKRSRAIVAQQEAIEDEDIRRHRLRMERQKADRYENDKVHAAYYQRLQQRY